MNIPDNTQFYIFEVDSGGPDRFIGFYADENEKEYVTILHDLDTDCEPKDKWSTGTVLDVDDYDYYEKESISKEDVFLMLL